mmetsp:Transcript_24287/g.34811  ORF Transcript_24287/g.34811 Transcript_24287/m.34811 type:complete len:297 (-) Transcript_24287:210-1100(-)
MSSAQYVKEAVKNVEQKMKENGRQLYKSSTPMNTDYFPELDCTPLLDHDDANYFQSQISILRWAVELGRLDIYVDVARLSSFLVHPRRGHLDAVYHIYGYLKHHDRSTLVFDDSPIKWTENDFQCYDWTDFYQDASEKIPSNAPEPRGNYVQINAFVDANHAGNRVTCMSHTGILIYLNKAPIIWYSKAQATVDTSTFGSEFVAMRIAIELIESLVPIDGPANVMCDNNYVVTNASIPSSTLKKKHVAICYHRVREAVASGVLHVAWIETSQNLADMFTKSLSGNKLHAFCQKIFY